MTTKKYYIPKLTYSTSSPTPSSDSGEGFLVGSRMINTSTGEKFECVDNTVGAAVWYQIVDCVDPADGIMPSFQTQLNNADTYGNVLITPQIYYQDDTIDYDVTIPGNAFSSGPITINSGRTVTVGTNGVWTIV